jgi:anaerobic selenocysteine-containing dehydrogenase/Fe-S-cluster-containing dehydrogenase component
MSKLDRRDFFKLLGIAGAAAATGCSRDTTRTLVPYVIPPEDIVPGEATWYATTCRECPAGCGIHAKNRDGRVIKVEGNPDHPINRGKLCARGQSSVQGLYSPDRFRGPLQRNNLGYLDPVSWDQAERLFVDKVSGGGRVVFLSELITGATRDLVRRWLIQTGSGEMVLYEPFAYEALRRANQIVFGVDGIPSYRIDRSDFLISFDAPFLETWLSNVEYARQFADFHQARADGKHLFFHVGPRFSMTAASADEWIAVRPGTEHLAALALLRVIVDEKLAFSGDNASIARMIEPFSLDEAASRTGASRQMLQTAARLFARARRPLALSGGLTHTDPNAVATSVAANLLCTLVGGTREAIDFGAPLSCGDVASAERMKGLTDRMEAGDVAVLVIYNANPVFGLPQSWGFERALRNVPFIVSLSSYPDETSSLAHLVMPSDTFLESWGDYSPREGVRGIIQPAMGRFFDTRHFGDILISTGNKIRSGAFPMASTYETLRKAQSEAAWEETLRRGGVWESSSRERTPAVSKSLSYAFPRFGKEKQEPGFSFIPYPTVQFFDGRTANRLWIQELPDPITMTTWGGWIELHTETAKRLNISAGDLVRVRSPYGSLDAPALPFFTVLPNVIAMPIGQGHTKFSGWADGLPANPMALFAPGTDEPSGGIGGPSFRVTLEKLKGTFHIAHTDGSYDQHGREIAQTLPLKEYQDQARRGDQPGIRLPLPEGFRKEVDFYPIHFHDQYRWAMAVDLDRCIGCGACVVACYAENNVPVVGRKEVIHQREMSWLRIQRYFIPGDKTRLRYLPMLCQHCDEAPCESVCPVFAPHHGREGINNQIYNRCIGTRDCSQNCPYKVRRFNFFNWKNPDPLPYQYNPDVTVRQQGVMEKCSFCVQRVVLAKTIARDEGRLIRDGEFTTACAQTCPAGVFTFGNLKDPNSRVAKLVREPRAYQVFSELNTKPGVIYLKKITQDVVTGRM